MRIASEGFLDTRSASFEPAAGLSRTSRSNSNHLPLAHSPGARAGGGINPRNLDPSRFQRGIR